MLTSLSFIFGPIFRREYKEFLKMQDDAWGTGDVTNSGLADKRESKRKSIINRKSRVSFR